MAAPSSESFSSKASDAESFAENVSDEQNLDRDGLTVIPPIQWYPGHIAKMERALKPNLKLVDMVIEVLDARLPRTSTNHKLQESLGEKRRIRVLNKSDLADPGQTERWKHKLSAEQTAWPVLVFDAMSGKQRQKLIQSVAALGEPIQQKMLAQGRKRRPLRVMVVGMPNVGKSSIINCLVAQKKAKTGHKAGVTRTTQWIRIHPEIELLDSPGIIPPALDSPQAGALLACVHSVGEAAFDEESVATFLLERIDALYPGFCHRHFKLEPSAPLTPLSVALARNYKLTGEDWDLLRAASAILHDFRQGRTGRLTLEWLPPAEAVVKSEAPLIVETFSE